MHFRLFIGILLTSLSVIANKALGEPLSGVPARLTETTANELFDESINHQVGFSFSQEDPRLKDIFDAQNKSKLCVPTALSMALAYLKFWRMPAFPALSVNIDPINGDFSAVVRTMAERCRTNRTSGTNPKNLYDGIKIFAQDSGFSHFDLHQIGYNGSADEHRPVTVDDIRNFVKKDYGLILSLHYFKYDKISKTWTPDPVIHTVQLVGYDYDSSWGDEQIVLKIVNPEVDYHLREPTARWDSLDLFKIHFRPDVKYPAMTNYFASGAASRGVQSRAFVWNLTAFLPDAGQ